MWSVGMLSIFDTARMTDLGSKIGSRTLKSLKIFGNVLIHQGGSYHSDHNVMLI